MGRRRNGGQFCWCCGRVRANERFSGRGHGRHLCRDCQKLDPGELAYRQERRNIERLLDWSGLVRRKQRQSFDGYLQHPNERVRHYAAEIAERDRRLREQHGTDMMLCETSADPDGWDDWVAWEPVEVEWDPDTEDPEHEPLEER